MPADILPSELSFAEHGAQLWAGAAIPILRCLEEILATQPSDRPGLRLHDNSELAPLLGVEGSIGALVALHMRSRPMPVRAILFDKTSEINWALGWHQDRTIAVAARFDVAGFGPWTVKQGVVHVAPPFALLAGMLTIRIHLDRVGPDNAPLLVAPGSHRTLVPEPEIDRVVAAWGSVACLAERGDVWAYATPIVHASNAAILPARRRVLQVDYACEALPEPLRWRGI